MTIAGRGKRPAVVRRPRVTSGRGDPGLAAQQNTRHGSQAQRSRDVAAARARAIARAKQLGLFVERAS